MPEHFFKYEFVYIFLFFGFVFLICSAFFKNKKIKLFFSLFFSVFFGLGLFEFVLNDAQFVAKLNKPQKFDNRKKILQDKIVNVTRQVYTKDKYNNYTFRYYPDRFKKLNVNKENNKIIYDVCYSLLPNKFRYTECNKNSDNIYIFLGCSFTFGSGLEDNETLPYYFSKLMNFENNVLNCGLPSKGSASALNILNNDIVNRFIGKKHIKYFIYSLIHGHLDRNFNVLDYEANDNWICENNKWQRIKQPFEIIKIVLSRSYIFRKIFLPKIENYNKTFYEDYLFNNLKEIDKLVREKYNSKLIIIVWPDILQSKRFYDKLKRTNFDMIMLPSYIMDRKYRIVNDRHPNSLANEIIANLLKKHIDNII